MGLCVLYYVEYSLYNVKKVGFFLSGLELHFKFKDTKSKNIVKNSLRNLHLRDSLYNVTEQFPPEVLAKRKLLYPVMVDARKSRKKAVLVDKLLGDKLYINNKLYDPTKKGD